MDRIQERIKKLLAIGGEGSNASESEIETAMAMASRLMLQHGIDAMTLQESIDNPNKDELEQTYDKVNAFATGERGASWEKSLASVIAIAVPGVGCYLNGAILARNPNGTPILDDNGNNVFKFSVTFYGGIEDCQIAKMVYEQNVILIATMTCLRWGNAWRGAGADYASGFVAGLRSKLEDDRDRFRAQLTTDALMVRMDRSLVLADLRVELAKEWLHRTHGIKLTKGAKSNRRSSFNRDAYENGRADGRSHNLNVNRQKRLT